MREIFERLYYVGVNDRKSALFEGLWPLPMGVSYNTYIVKGDNATALIDGVGAEEVEELQLNLEKTIGRKSPDYLIVNHMEPDHSGGLGMLHRCFPDMKIVGNAKTLDMVRGYYHLPDQALMLIKEGEVIDLGGATLRFVMTPMVHWPETMMTYCQEMKVLFTGDAFGCFGALNGAIVDDDMDIEPYIPEMYRYYSNIVGKYGMFVQKALAKVGGYDIDYLCTTHGPVWHQSKDRIVGIYDRLSRWESEDGVTIVYGSMYGHTERMAEIVAERLAERGVRKICIHNASKSPLSNILADIFRYKAVLIAAPTYNNSLFPPIEALMMAIKVREVKNKAVAIMGSYTWASQAVKKMQAHLQDCKLIDEAIPVAEAKQDPDEAVYRQCIALADALADKSKGI